MSKKFLLLVLVCGLVLFTSCGKKKFDNSNSAVIDLVEELNTSKTEGSKLQREYLENYEIKLAFSTNMQDPRAKASELFKQVIEEKSNGRITVSLFPEGKLGSDDVLISKVIRNEVDMTISSAGNYAAYVSPAGFSAMPFLFSNFEEAWAFLASKENQKITDSFEAYNMVVLGYFDNGFRCVTTSESVGPVKSVDDMKGLKIRTSQNQIVMETMVQLNATPKSYPFAELKEALRNKMFDAQENPIPVIYNNKLYEVQKYLAITNHSYDAMPFTIRKSLWDNFKAEDQAILRDAAEQAQNLNRQLVKNQTEKYISELTKAGMVITYPDIGAFKEATEGVFDVFAPVYGDELIKAVKNK